MTEGLRRRAFGRTVDDDQIGQNRRRMQPIQQRAIGRQMKLRLIFIHQPLAGLFGRRRRDRASARRRALAPLNQPRPNS